MARKARSTDMIDLGFKAWGLWAEATMVVGMRMMGMAGLWTTRPDENLRMIAEKPAALSAAAMAGASAALRGDRPDRIARATMAPLTRKARSNRRRLAKAGPKSPLL